MKEKGSIDCNSLIELVDESFSSILYITVIFTNIITKEIVGFPLSFDLSWHEQEENS